MGTEKRRKNEGERAKMLENTEIVREKTQQTLGAVYIYIYISAILTEELLDSLERES